MIVLDENVDDDQWALLRRWHTPVCQIGRDIGRSGMKDPEILPLLRTLRRPTFVSRDRAFFDKSFCHDRFCLTFLDVWPTDAAAYTRRLLRHPNFKTWAQRQGCVIRVRPTGILVWRVRGKQATRHSWDN